MSEAATAPTLTEAAQRFVASTVTAFPSIVLSRVFVLVPFSRLPAADAEVAGRFASKVGGLQLLSPSTPVLSLLGTRGKNPQWNDRALSNGHLATPLLSRALVEGIPMIAKLLAEVGVDLTWLEDAGGLDSRRMLGSGNQCFYVRKASEAKDSLGRLIIPSQTFVAEYAIETVFGAAGGYVDGTMLAAISFSTEVVSKSAIDRFPSLIASFKMATAHLAARGSIYPNTDTE